VLPIHTLQMIKMAACDRPVIYITFDCADTHISFPA